MKHRAAHMFAGLLAVSRQSSTPMYMEIYRAIRSAIAENHFDDGTRLPSSRRLAMDLGVSRTTVLDAYAQLAAEGLVGGRRGGGTRVTKDAHHYHRKPLSFVDSSSITADPTAGEAQPLSNDANLPISSADRALPFALGIPPLDSFPSAAWARLAARRWRESPQLMLEPADGPGFEPLRKAIADYVVSGRGIKCSAHQIVITAGAQQAFCILSNLLIKRGDAVWLEDCGYVPARNVFAAVGARLVGIPVDSEGLDVAFGIRVASHARLALVTPACEPPFGTPMSLDRRMQLLNWAEERKAWIVEDDYNGELRYQGRPPAALAATDHPGAKRVIYVRTFSKTLFPALRLGFAVLPTDLVPSFAQARLLLDRHSPTAEQTVLTDFIVSGQFARYVRSVSAVCAARQRTFLKLASEELGTLVKLQSAPAGLRVVGLLPAQISDRCVVDEAAKRGVKVEALSMQTMGASSQSALVLGYAAFLEEETRMSLKQLANAILHVQNEL